MPVRKSLPKILLYSLLFFFFPQLVLAQTPTGIATTYTIDDPEAVTGDIICFIEPEGKLKRCDRPYDERVFGVLVESPQIVLRNTETGAPIVREGRAVVNVTSANGSIKPGDYLTTSATAGKGQRATDTTGYVVGRGLNSLEGNAGQVEVALSIGPTIILSRSNLLDQLGFALVKNVQKPEGAALFVRYVTAGLTAILITLFAFNNFAKNITKGIESVGRNPLARHQIQFIVVINIILIAAITLGGLILSLAIIRL